jgi:predicted metalloprotease with PDZ domain
VDVPAGLATPSFDTPMQNYMLWVYEGQTQYWGNVLAARSGLLTKEQALQSLALVAATYDNRKGRSWRSLEDTVHEPIISGRRPQPWRSFQRPEDYYSEGQLIWLDADTLIRERTRGARSLDTFARRFFEAPEIGLTESPYTFEDVVAALNAVMPYDWAGFLRTRIDAVGGPAPLDGLARGGWRLVYAEERTDFQKAAEKRAKNADFMYSLGFVVGEDKKLSEVLWDSPAFNAGLTVGVEIMAANGVAYDADGLRRAITAAKAEGGAVELLVKAGDRYRTVSIPYTGGLRYPRLERISGTADRLSAILAPRR